MAKVRILRRHDKSYIELPSDLAKVENHELEMFQLRDGYYLISSGITSQNGGQPKNQGSDEMVKSDAHTSETHVTNLTQQHAVSEMTMNNVEREVVRKLLSIKFGDRIPSNVSSSFSANEMETIRYLEKKGLVSLFKSKKYPHGVYNITDRAYSLSKQMYTQTENAPANGSGANPASVTPSSSSLVAVLNSQGFMVLQNRQEAASISEQLAKDLRTGAVIGIKGFDGKFYLVTRGYLTAAQTSIGSVLKDDMEINSIASAAKLDSQGCIAVLRLMAESGDIIEKRKGIFSPI